MLTLLYMSGINKQYKVLLLAYFLKNLVFHKNIFIACNRTYYGEVGRTYELELHRPKEDKVPYICHLTFTANGGEFGDLIQVSR